MEVKILYDYELNTKLVKNNFFNEYEKELNLYLQEGYKILDSNMVKTDAGTWSTTGIYTLLAK